MLVVFEVSGEVFEVRVDKDRLLSMRGSLTNNEFLSLDEMTKKSGEDPRAAAVTAAIVRDLKALDDVEYYVIQEFSEKGVRHVKTVVEDGDG